MRRCWVILIMLLTTGDALPADDPARGHDLVILAADPPIRVRLQMTVDGKSLADRRESLIDSLLKTADTDGDGQWNPTEWQAALAGIGQSKKSGAVSRTRNRESAIAALAEALGPKVEFREQPRPLVDRLELLTALDQNGDRVLSEEELRRAPELLRYYDADGNGVLDMAELAPNEPLQLAVTNSLSEFPEQFAPLRWEPVEGNADIEVRLDFFTGGIGLARVAAQLAPSDRAETIKIIRTRHAGEISSGDFILVLDAPLRLISSEDVRRFYLIQMRQRDVGRKGYLTQDEFRGLALPMMRFEAADRNGDGKLYPEELRETLDGLIAWRTSRLGVSLSQEREPLFPKLDVDGDGRLSRRELANAKMRLIEEESGSFTLDELVGRCRWEFRVPGLLEDAPQQMTQDIMAANTANQMPDGPGPAWFHAMDRNGDGDVDRREFLGRLELFNEWDQNQDQLLDLVEIERVTEE